MKQKTPKNLLGKYNSLMREERAESKANPEAEGFYHDNKKIRGGKDYADGHGMADGHQKKDAYMPISNQALFGVSNIPTKKNKQSENTYHHPMKSKPSKISGGHEFKGVTSKKTPTTKGEGPTYNPRSHIGKPRTNYKGKSFGC